MGNHRQFGPDTSIVRVDAHKNVDLHVAPNQHWRNFRTSLSSFKSQSCSWIRRIPL